MDCVIQVSVLSIQSDWIANKMLKHCIHGEVQNLESIEDHCNYYILPGQFVGVLINCKYISFEIDSRSVESNKSVHICFCTIVCKDVVNLKLTIELITIAIDPNWTTTIQNLQLSMNNET